MTSSDQWIPKLLTWIAHEDIQEEVDHREREDTPDTDLDCHEHGQVSLTVGDEDPEVLEKYRELDEEDISNVDDYGGIEPLVAPLISSRIYFERIDHTSIVREKALSRRSHAWIPAPVLWANKEGINNPQRPIY